MRRTKLGLLLLVLAAMLALLCVTASAASVSDLEYEIANGEVTITGCGSSASGKLTIPSKIEGKPVTSIGSAAFFGCRSLTRVEIPDSVTEMGGGVFCNCSKLESVKLSNQMTELPSYYTFEDYDECFGFFEGCSSLTSVTIPDSVTEIDTEAFFGCRSLTRVEIPDSVTEMGGGVFCNCSKLESVKLSNQMTELSYSLDDSDDEYTYNGFFEHCSSLTSVTIPDSVTSIDWYAFSDCTSLTSVTIGNGVKSIEEYAFENCTGLTSVTIPDSVTSVEGDAFCDCSSLKSVTIGKGVESFDWYAFSGCSSLTQINVSTGNDSFSSKSGVLYNKDQTELVCYPAGKTDTSFVIPDSVISIDGNAFSGCTGLKNVTIPDSVTSIGRYAFSGCKGLTNVTIPDSVTSIGEYAFSGCTGLTSVTIPNSVTSIEKGAFLGCKSLTSVTIPDSVKSVGWYAFSDCTGLTRVTIPDSVTSIDGKTFSGCTGLTSITIPDSVTSIGSGAFSGCTGLTSITIPDSVKSISWDAFSGCKSLTSITIPDSVKSIDWNAFSGCTGLTSVTIPDSVTSIGSGAFSGCTGLTDVYYTGTEKQWNTIAIESRNDPLETATIHYNYASVVIKTQPKNVSVTTDETANISVKTTGENLSYQWQVKKSASSNWVNSTASGSKTATVKPQSKAGNDGYQYRCKVTDGAGYTVTSKTVTLRVTAIATQPKNLSVKAGDATAISVKATGPDLTYQWQVKKSSSGNWETSTASGSKTATVKPQSKAGNDGYQYRCVVTDANGKRVTSGTATLRVTAIATQPKNLSVKVGDATAISVKATGPDLTYQWQVKKSSSGSWETSTASGSKTATVKPQSKAGNDGYQYRCVVTDANGKRITSNVATFHVTAITTQPKAASVKTTAYATFKVAATGDGLKYQWQYLKPNGSWVNCTSATQGYNTATLKVQGVTGSTNRNGYQYRCKVTDSAGNTVTSSAVKLSVLAITTQPKAASVTKSGTATFTVKATGSGLKYQWQFKTPSGDWKNCTSKTEGYNTATIKVQGASGSTNRNGYQYRCVITDAAGSKLTTSAVKLTVK